MRELMFDDYMKDSKTLHIVKDSVPAVLSDGYKLHSHSFIEIVYTLSGEMVHSINGTQCKTSRGDILFMNCGCRHMFMQSGEYTYVNILFSPTVISENIVTSENALTVQAFTAFHKLCRDKEFGKISFFGEERREMESIVRSMLTEYENKGTSWETLIGNYFSTLLIKMLRKTECGTTSDEMGGVWQELTEYIETNLDSELSLSSLAKMCFYNPSYFSRIFKEKFGVSLMEYITQKRLERAIYLLENTETTIDSIAHQTGFSGRSGLYHSFIRHLGVTPNHYRKK